MYKSDAKTEGRIGVVVEELASATAEQVFLDAEVDASGNLTLEGSKRWYTDIPSGLGSIRQTQSEDAEYSSMEEEEEEAAVSSIEDLRRATSLGYSSVNDVLLDMVAEEVEDDGSLSREAFSLGFRRLGFGTGNVDRLTAVEVVRALQPFRCGR